MNDLTKFFTTPEVEMHSFKQYISESYDIIPKTDLEIDELKTNHDKQNLKDLLKYIAIKTGVSDPIALSKSPKKSGIKVLRSVADELDLNSLSKQFGFKLTPGNGSRGGTGKFNAGLGFEGQIVSDIQKYIEEGVDSLSFKYPEFMKKLHSEILSKHNDIRVILEGGKNTKRPLVFTDVGVMIKGRELQIGKYLTDVTVFGDGTPYYLSLKYGGTVTFFNAGVSRIFTEDQFKAGKITNPNAKQLLNMFGIDEKRFIDIFEGYDKKSSGKSSKQIVDVTRQVNMRSLLKLLVTGIGYGYYMIHKKGKKVEFYEMTKRRMMDSAKVQSVKILYPKTGSAKRIDVEVVTKLYIYKINIRNKQGGLYPSHIMCDYKPNPSST